MSAKCGGGGVNTYSECSIVKCTLQSLLSELQENAQACEGPVPCPSPSLTRESEILMHAEVRGTSLVKVITLACSHR